MSLSTSELHAHDYFELVIRDGKIPGETGLFFVDLKFNSLVQCGGAGGRVGYECLRYAALGLCDIAGLTRGVRTESRVRLPSSYS